MNLLRRRASTTKSTSPSLPQDTSIVWEGWLTKAGEKHKNFKDRYARVFMSTEQLILTYHASNEQHVKEKGRLNLSNTITYFCCNTNNRATIYLVLPTRTWIFSYPSEELRTVFIQKCLTDASANIIKEGWLSIPQTFFGSMRNVLGNMLGKNTRKHCVVLDSGFVLVFKTETYTGYESAFDIHATSSIRTTDKTTDKTTDGEDSLILTSDPFELALSTYEEKKQVQQNLQESLLKLEAKGNKLKKQFSNKDLLKETTEKNYKKYMKRWNTKTATMQELNHELKKLESVMATSKDEQVVVHRWFLDDRGGYLLGPKAELSSWLIALEDSRDGTNNSGCRGETNETTAAAAAATARNKHRRGSSQANLVESRGSGKGNGGNSSSNTSSNSSTSRSGRTHRKKRNQHKREKNSESGPSLVEDPDGNEESLPEGWKSAEFVHPATKRRQSYFFHQHSTGGTSTTWTKPTEPYIKSKEKKEAVPQSQQESQQESQQVPQEVPPEVPQEDAKEAAPLRSRSRRLSAEGKSLLRQSMTGAGASDDASVKYPNQKNGTSREASDEATEWSQNKTLSEMLQHIHEISYLISEQMLQKNEVNYDDPELMLANIQKSYRKSIRQLHPDRTTRRKDVNNYEKALGSSLFSILKEKMTQ